MSELLLAAIAESLCATTPFHDLPAKNRPHNILWQAYNDTLKALRMPLYHHRLGKSRPKPKAYDDALQMGLALLACFAHVAGTHRAIVRIKVGLGDAISFQPRPWAANWTAPHALQPEHLADPEMDPMTVHGMRPQVSTADILHLSRLVALTFIKADEKSSHKVNGTATLEFHRDDWDRPTVRLIWRLYGQPNLAPRTETLRYA